VNRIIAASLLALGLCAAPATAQKAPATDAPAAPAPAAEAAPPHGQDDAIGQDVRCLYVYMAMGTSDKPEMQTAAVIGTFFWYGKLSGRIADSEIEDRIVAVIAAQNAESFMADARRCGDQMVERGKAMKTLGAHLEEKGAEQQAEKPQPEKPLPGETPHQNP
jgi:hypothetical protein